MANRTPPLSVYPSLSLPISSAACKVRPTSGYQIEDAKEKEQPNLIESMLLMEKRNHRSLPLICRPRPSQIPQAPHTQVARHPLYPSNAEHPPSNQSRCVTVKSSWTTGSQCLASQARTKTGIQNFIVAMARVTHLIVKAHPLLQLMLMHVLTLGQAKLQYFQESCATSWPHVTLSPPSRFHCATHGTQSCTPYAAVNWSVYQPILP